MLNAAGGRQDILNCGKPLHLDTSLENTLGTNILRSITKYIPLLHRGICPQDICRVPEDL